VQERNTETANKAPAFSTRMSDLAFQISLLLCSLILLAGMAAGMLAIPRMRVELEPVRAEHDPRS
jgi:hypothetical protein